MGCVGGQDDTYMGSYIYTSTDYETNVICSLNHLERTVMNFPEVGGVTRHGTVEWNMLHI
jgi:hypothetical protein